MKRRLGTLSLLLWYLSALLLVVLAVLVSLGQYYFPYLGERKNELLALATRELPFGVEMDTLRAEWTGLAPTFYIEGLRLYAKDDPGLTIASTTSSEVRIDLLRSLLARAPRLRKFIASDIRLGFVADDVGWRLTGVERRQAPSNPGAIQAFFLDIGEIEFSKAHLALALADGHQADFDDVELHLENYRRFRRLRAGMVNPEDGSKLALIVEAHGDPRRPLEFDAKAYLSLEKTDLGRIKPLFAKGAMLPDARVSGAVWADLLPGGKLRLQGNLNTPSLSFASIPGLAALHRVRQLDLHFSAQREGDKATLWVEGLQMHWYRQHWAIDRLRLDATQQDAVRYLRIGADYLDVGGLAKLIEKPGLVSEKWASAIAELDPDGGMSNAVLDLAFPANGKADFRFRTQAVDVSASPWLGAPGISNANGYVEATPVAGFVELSSGPMSLRFPKVFRDDLDLDAASGRVDWHVVKGELEVKSNLLSLRYGSAEVTGEFALERWADENLDDQLMISIGLRNGDASLRNSLLPWFVDKGIHDWLDASAISGGVESAAFFYHGVFARPSHPASHRFQLGLELDQAALSFHPDWPRISEIKGRALIDGSDVRVWADTGRVLNSQLSNTRVEMRTNTAGRRVVVKGTLTGDVADGLQVLNDSPVTPSTGGILQDWQAHGSMQVDLDLDIPLAGGVTRGNGSRVKVLADIADAQLLLPSLKLQFDNVHGGIGFDLDAGLQSRGLDAELWGKPVLAQIARQEMAPDLSSLSLTGVAAAPGVMKWLGLDAGTYIDGETPFTAELDQQPDGRLKTLVSSDLSGVTLTLPSPFAKTANQTVPFRYEQRGSGAGKEVRVDYGAVLKARLLADAAGGIGGEVMLGGAEAQAGGTGIRVTGVLNQTDVPASVGIVRGMLTAHADWDPSDAEAVRLHDLRIGESQLFGGVLHDLVLNSSHDATGVIFDLKSDAMSGDIRLPTDKTQPLGVHLADLQLATFIPLKKDEPEAEPSAARDHWQDLRGQRIPATEVRIDHLRKDQRELGQWRFGLASDLDGLRLSAIDAVLPELRLTGDEHRRGAEFSLLWGAEQSRCQLAGNLEFANIGKVFEAWGYSNVLESRKGTVAMDLSWPGSPTDMAASRLTGRIDFKLEDGRVLKSDSNNPLMRAFGIFNMHEILRRLQFDFKDFYRTGLAFDRFNGDIDLAEGTASTRQPVELVGPSARLKISGTSDLNTRAVQADLIVTLPIASNLPWVAVLAGGPAGVAAAYVASQLFEEQLGKIASMGYRVTGTIEEPKLEYVKMFDMPGAAGAQQPATTSQQETLPRNPDAPGGGP